MKMRYHIGEVKVPRSEEALGKSSMIDIYASAFKSKCNGGATNMVEWRWTLTPHNTNIILFMTKKVKCVYAHCFVIYCKVA